MDCLEIISTRPVNQFCSPTQDYDYLPPRQKWYHVRSFWCLFCSQALLVFVGLLPGHLGFSSIHRETLMLNATGTAETYFHHVELNCYLWLETGFFEEWAPPSGHQETGQQLHQTMLEVGKWWEVCPRPAVYNPTYCLGFSGALGLVLSICWSGRCGLKVYLSCFFSG